MTTNTNTKETTSNAPERLKMDADAISVLMTGLGGTPAPVTPKKEK